VSLIDSKQKQKTYANLLSGSVFVRVMAYSAIWTYVIYLSNVGFSMVFPTVLTHVGGRMWSTVMPMV